MILDINNVFKVDNAHIQNSGVTMVAGYNDTGKSTILKSMYVYLESFGNYKSKIENERWNSLNRAILRKESLFDDNGFEELPITILTDIISRLKEKIKIFKELDYNKFKKIYLEVISGYTEQNETNLLYKDDFIISLYDGIETVMERSTSEYLAYITKMNFLNTFGSRYGSLINDKDSIIKSDGTSDRYIRFNNAGINIVGEELSVGNVIYLETKNIIDDYDKSNRRNNFRRYLYKDPIIENYEQYEEIENNKNALNEIFEEVLHGKLQKGDMSSLRYYDNNIGKPIDLKNVASGMKSLLIIQRLVENGVLTKDSWLLFDEPETNLHPEWHIKMAELLVLMNKEMGINVVVSSHSTYFIRALEVKLAMYNIKQNGKFYLMSKADNDNMYSAVDVTDNTEKIYEQLYKPLEDL